MENEQEYSSRLQSNEISPMVVFMNKHKTFSEAPLNSSSGILREKNNHQMEKKIRRQRESERDMKMTDYLDYIITVFFILSFVIVIILVISSIIWWRMQMF